MATEKKPERLLLTSNPVNYSLEVLCPKRKKCYNRVPMSMDGNYHLNHPDLTKGQKTYLWSICSIYSTSQMKTLVQEQFLNQVFYEMRKGIIKSADWLKYIEYIADPTKRKQQFQSLSPSKWKAPKDQYQFRYYRDNPVRLPKPTLPPFVNEEIAKKMRPPPQPKRRPIYYVPRRRRKGVGNSSPGTSGGVKSAPFVPPLFPARPKTSLGFVDKNKSPVSPDIGSYSSTFISSSNGVSDQSSSDHDANRILPQTQGEGLTRPKSRISSAQRRNASVR